LAPSETFIDPETNEAGEKYFFIINN